MCFLIDEKHPNKKIAKKDIVCYKRLKVCPSGGFFSPYQGKFYRLNKLYRSKIGPIFYRTINSGGIINVGLHSYSCKKHAMSCLDKGCHEVLAKGIIPKGSRYYYNPISHEYVSNQIIIQEVIK